MIPKFVYKLVALAEALVILALLWRLRECHRGLQGFAGRLTGRW